MKHLLAKWTHWILAVLSPLGIWGVMGFAFVDAAFLGMPLDAIVGGYVYAAPRRFLLLSAMAAAGSALGSIVIYWIGYKGGEVLLVKRIGEERFNKIQRLVRAARVPGDHAAVHAAAADAVQAVRAVGGRRRDALQPFSAPPSSLGRFLRFCCCRCW